MYRPATYEAYRLLHDGSIALADVEANGIAVDRKYLDSTTAQMKREIKEDTAWLQEQPIWKKWKHAFGANAKLRNRKQMAHVIFELMGMPRAAVLTLETGQEKPEKNDEAAFQDCDHPFVRRYIALSKKEKVLGTYLTGISRALEPSGLIHPVFNLHIARTYRSSSDSPNFQNWPVRNPEIAKLLRQCFIPRNRRKRVLVEIDYSGIEVRVAACYHKDPVMFKYIKDPSKDMHRDMAAQCFKCNPDDVSKLARYCGKNMFVFPEFYGSYYMQCAPALWDACSRMSLKVGDVPMREHLASEGITKLGSLNPKDKPRIGTFTNHIKEVEHDFWSNRFKVYNKWKKSWYEQYLSEGGFSSFTGFRYEGIFNRNDVINYPVQGAAFHCLMWSLTKLNRRMQKYKMRSQLVGQIHDSIVGDIYIDELHSYLEMACEIMTQEIREAWPWIVVPLDVEAEVAPLGGTWNDKKAVDLSNIPAIAV